MVVSIEETIKNSQPCPEALHVCVTYVYLGSQPWDV